MAESETVFRAAEIATSPFDFRHPLQDDAEIRLFGLSHMAGLKQCGVTLAHLDPGKTSFPLHRHYAEEEWIFLLSGSATLTLDEDTTELAPGDFAAFRPGGPAHKLVNTGTETLIYLMGGSKAAMEVVDFPDTGQRMVRIDGEPGQISMAESDAFKPYDPMARMKSDD